MLHINRKTKRLSKIYQSHRKGSDFFPFIDIDKENKRQRQKGNDIEYYDSNRCR